MKVKGPPHDHGAARRRNLWAREQGVELSRLVLGFARQRMRLPDVGDRGFWQRCQGVFKGVFTHKQVQAKVRNLHLRFRRCASGAKFRVSERHILNIWIQILQLISPSSPPTQGPSTSPRTQGSESGMGHGSAPRTSPGVGPGKKGAEQTARQEASTCSTDIDYHSYLQEEVHVNGEFQNNAANSHAASGADDEDYSRNKTLLHHLTVADLASAVKTLAEIVARGPNYVM